MHVFKLFILLFSIQAFAKDPNILLPSDLPKTTIRSFRSTGRAPMPEFEKDYGLLQALKDKRAEVVCKGPVGKQLSEWKVEKIMKVEIYWEYNISAQFECLPPIISTIVENADAIELSNALQGITKKTINGIEHKDAKVLCYDFYTDKCPGDVLVSMYSNSVCELADLNSPTNQLKIEDILDENEVVQNQGANKLMNLLPVYTDERRDDSPSGNCKPHIYRELKGLSRQAATVSCTKVGKNESCQVNGLIKSSL